MKTLEEFVVLFSEQLEETDPSTINSNTAFHDIDEWSSLTALAVTAMISEEFEVSLKVTDLKTAITIEDLYRIIERRENNQ